MYTLIRKQIGWGAGSLATGIRVPAVLQRESRARQRAEDCKEEARLALERGDQEAAKSWEEEADRAMEGIH